MDTNEKGTRKSGRSRYWSVMLVGDHGRVIPFRHFKALTFGVSIVLLLSLSALILLAVLYTRQRGQVERLQTDLEQMRVQNTKFRDEKDLYLTQLIALQKQTGAPAQKPPDAAQGKAEGGPPAEEAEETSAVEEPAPEVEEVKKETPEPAAEPSVQWSADIRDFKVSYDNRQGVLTAQFRIYNTSRPKKRLSGRTVAIFKAIGDPSSRWALVPEVPLEKEIPLGKKGRPFSIRNYQTEYFKTSRRTNSPEYDIAAVYVFADQDGELIGKKELPFNVDYSPPEPIKPAIAPPKPEPEKSAGQSRPPQPNNSGTYQSKPADSMAPNPAPTNDESPDPIESSDSPSGQPAPATPSDQKTPESRPEPNGSNITEPGAPEAVPQLPVEEPKPEQEGDAN